MAVKLGIVGCGGISHAHAEAIIPIKHKIQFAACCDVNRARADEWAQQYNVPQSYADMEEMIAAENLDAVLLATWPNQHREQIEACLKTGIKNILCEKALTITGKEGTEIFDLADDAGAFLMEGFMYRHHPATRKIENLISWGEIGEVDYVRAAFNDYDPETVEVDDEDRNWRQRKECGGGVPYDFACYAINACGHFAGGIPLRVTAYGNVSPKYDVVNRLFGMVEYSNGRIGMVISTKKSDSNQELAVFGSGGILRLPISWTILGDIELEREHSVSWADLRQDIHTIPKADPYSLQLENFADVVEEKAVPVVPLAQSVINAYTTEAMVRSALEKECIQISIPDRIVKSYQEYLEGNK